MLWALRNNWLWVLRSLSTAGSWVATRGWHRCVEWSHIGCRYISNWSGDFVLKFVSSEEAWHQVSLQQASVWSPQTLHPSSQLRHKVCTHARTRAFGFRRSLRAGSQGRRADWKMTAHDVRDGKNSAMWAVASTKWNWNCRPKFSSHRDVPGSTHTTTDRISGTRSGPPQELTLCTGTAHLVALWLDSASTKFCYRRNWTGTFTVLSHSRLGVLSQCGFFPFSFQLISFFLIF
jgi:hypothetical protein